ncbi:MAG: hypothetical protein AB7T49_21475 [Oligoflexales bacterium]
MSASAYLLSFLYLLGLASSGSLYGCPQTGAEWQRKLELFASQLTPDIGNDDLYNGGPKLLPASRYNEVLSFWKSCADAASPGIKGKYQNLLKHSRFMSQAMSQGHAGFDISDEDYLFASYKTNPEFAAIPEVFFKDGYLPPDWRKIVADCGHDRSLALCGQISGWKFIDFDSTLEDGSGNSERLIIHIPHEAFQQYLLFFPKNPKDNQRGLIDIIALQTKDLVTLEPLDRTRIFFFERHRKGFALDGGRCYGCHPNGLRELHPVQGSLTSVPQFQVIERFNRELSEHKRIDWGRVIDIEALGPPIGDSCSNCHHINGKRFPLTILTRPALIRSKIQELEMPYPNLYKSHFTLVNSLPFVESEPLKVSIKQIALSCHAKAGADYRSPEEIRQTRERIHRKLYESGFIDVGQFAYLRTTDILAAAHIDYKLRTFFRDYRARFHSWLTGERIN